MIIVLSLIYIGIMAIDAPRMFKDGLWRELVVYSLLWLLALIYSLGLVLNWNLPNLTHGLAFIFDPVGRYIQQILS